MHIYLVTRDTVADEEEEEEEEEDEVALEGKLQPLFEYEDSAITEDMYDAISPSTPACDNMIIKQEVCDEDCDSDCVDIKPDPDCLQPIVIQLWKNLSGEPTSPKKRTKRSYTAAFKGTGDSNWPFRILSSINNFKFQLQC